MRLGRWPRRWALALDAALALAVLAVGLASTAAQPGPASDLLAGVRLATGLLVAVGILFRRRWPVPLLVLTVLDGAAGGEASVTTPLAAYAVSRYHPAPRQRWLALVAVGVVVLAPWQLTSFDTAVNNLVLVGARVVLPAVFGAWMRTRVELVAALVDRAERAESEQQLRAREAVLSERARISREMHDVVGHRVSLMVLQAGAIDMAAEDVERVRRLAGQLQAAGRRSLEELRQLIGLLTADDGAAGGEVPLAPQPTLADLDDLVADARAAGVEAVMERVGEPRPVEETVGRTAFRVVQEALTNSGKHLPGGAVTVTVDFRPAELAVTVVNRRATRPPTALPSGGYGLVGLRERVRTVRGTLRAEPRLDGGFAVEAVLPA